MASVWGIFTYTADGSVNWYSLFVEQLETSIQVKLPIPLDWTVFIQKNLSYSDLSTWKRKYNCEDMVALFVKVIKNGSSQIAQQLGLR